MSLPSIFLYSKCLSFPACDDTLIMREYIIDTVKSVATQECPVVFVEGDDFIGKTTFLMQFAMHECSVSISTFINPSSKWAYNPDFIMSDLYEQIVYALSAEHDKRDVDATIFKNKIYELNKKAVRESIVYYFIIDGLDSIPEEDTQIRSVILSLFPFGLRNFRFIISGASQRVVDDILMMKVKYTKYPLAGFSLDETRKYFSNIDCSSKTIEEIYKITKKPGILCAIKRLLETGQIVEENIDELSNKLSSLLDIEWKQVDEANEPLLMLLSIAAYDKKTNTIDDLSRIAGLENRVVDDYLRKLTFMKIDSTNNTVTYISEPFRKFTSNKLKDYKSEATKRIIDDLYTNPYSGDSMKLLPAFLSETGNYGQLLNYMTPDYFTEMIRCCQSLSPIIKTADIGVNAATATHNNGELFRFGVQKSIISQLDGAAIWRSEIEANMAIGDYAAALALAQSTATKEDRLHAFAIIAKSKREQGLSEDEELGDIIRQLCREIDFSSQGKRGYEIAEDLLPSYPELAIELAEKASNISEDEKSLDIALTKMSIATLGGSRDGAMNEKFETIKSKIKNRTIKDFLTVTAYVFGNYSVRILLSEIEKLESKADALMLLRQWLKVNRRSTESHIVMEYALNLTISTSEYAPNATDFKEIAAPLPFVVDKEIVKNLLSKFDSQKGVVERLGPTEDYVRFEIMLASSALSVGMDDARDRFVEIYYYINSIDDIVIRGSSYAYMLTMLTITDKEFVLEQKDNLHTVLKDALNDDVKIILAGTADQFDSMKKIIFSVAKYDIAQAIDIVNILNTQNTRDKGYCEIVRSAVTGPFTNFYANIYDDVVGKIRDDDIKDESLARIYDYFYENYGRDSSLVGMVIASVDRLSEICDLEYRCKSICTCFNAIYATSEEVLKSRLLHDLDEAWEHIDDEWVRINVGYNIVKRLAKSSVEIARAYVDKIVIVKREVFIESGDIALNYISCIYLTMRAFSGLIYKNIYSDDDLTNIIELINDIDSNSEKAKLLSVLAMYFYKYKKQDVGEKIVLERVRPLLDTIKDSDNYNKLVSTISPALYFAHRAIADEILSKLHESYRDDAHYNICKYYLTKTYYTDPYDDGTGFVYKCMYSDIYNICDVLSKIESDSYIYMLIDDITYTIKKRRDDFTRQQKEEVARKFTEIVNAKLPNPKYIKHDGYKIVSLASIGRISTQAVDWDGLIVQSRNVPNLADKALVLAVVYTCMPPKQRERYPQIPTEIVDTIQLIPSVYDQMSRYETIASTFREIDGGLSVQCLKLAMSATSKSDDPEIIKRQKRIVDLASRIDSTLASSFTKIYDDDPARAKKGSELKEHLKILELKKELVNELLNPEDLLPENLEKLPLASWRALSSLNANMVDTLKAEKIRDLVKLSSSLSMDMAYPILCLALQNLVDRYMKTDEATTIIRPSYEAVLTSCRLSKSMATRSSAIHLNAYQVAGKTTGDSVYIKSGQRDKAIGFLTEWLQSNLSEYLKICDPYFGAEDLVILRIIRGINTNVPVYILTSKQHQDSQYKDRNLEEVYGNYWKQHISEQEPPETDITVAGTITNGKLPIHDRWIITRGAGIRIGTSINSLGKGRDSEISLLSGAEAVERESQIDAFIRKEKKEHNAVKLRYTTFNL